LLLAAPVAIVSGLSRASRLGVVMRDGGALENLGRATTLVLDKTGTVTTGRPRGTDVLVAPGWTPSEVLRLAASADQVSPHVLARAIVEEAATRGLPLSMPADVVEEAGKGVTATVDGRRVTVGAAQLSSDAPPWAHAAESRAALRRSPTLRREARYQRSVYTDRPELGCAARRAQRAISTRQNLTEERGVVGEMLVLALSRNS
jgi:cation transport ATPase